MTASAQAPARLAPTIALVWLGIALAVGATGRLASLPVPGPQLVLLALSVATVVVGTRVAPIRAWIDAVPLRALVALHLTRFVGFAFLALSARGELSPLFAERAGVGDIVAAVLALALIVSGDPATRTHRRLYLAWNALGLLDFLVVVVSATWVATRHLVPGMQPLLRLPLSLLPTFLVPLLIASHIFMIRRLRALGRASRDA
jgi:hypothetical protein